MTEQVEKLTPEDGKSLDIEAQNIEQLKQLFPDVFREGKVDFEALKAVLGEHIEDADERYNFTWHGKNKARQIAQTPSTGTLRPCKEESVNWDTAQNLFIEGDNLEVLKLLQKAYNKKISMIFIDPPYNTGQDFIYKDNFANNVGNYLELTSQVDGNGIPTSKNFETSGRYHTDWLNMIYPRLKLARRLLSDDGLIFIQIDDNELVNLKKVCDEVFGEENLVNLITVKMSHLSGVKMSHVDKKLPKIKEFILVYSKNRNLVKLNPIYEPSKWDEALSRYTQFITNIEQPFEDWKYEPVRKVAESKGIDFKIDEVRESFLIDNAKNIFRTARNRAFPSTGIKGVFSKVTTATGLEKFVLNDEEVLFASEKMKLIDGKLRPANALGDIWSDIGINNLHNEGGVDFRNGKKPIKLLTRLIQLAGISDGIVLDFFGGSGSTAHAVMDFNCRNNNDLKFITVQLPESCNGEYEEYNTISDLCLDRIIKSGQTLKKEANSENFQNGVKVFKLDSSNITPWEATFETVEDMVEDMVDNIKSDRTEEDVLYEVLLKYGLDLTYPISEHDITGKRVFDVAFGSLIVCLDNEITNETIVGIGKLKKELDSETTRVVIKDAGYEDSCEKLNAIETLKQYGITDVKCL